MLDSLHASAKWGEWLDKLAALATGALNEPDRVLAVLAELTPKGPVGPVALNEVLLVLERLLCKSPSRPLRNAMGRSSPLQSKLRGA